MTSGHGEGSEPGTCGGRPDAGRRAGWLFALLVLVCVFHDLGARSLHELDTARWGQLARELIRSGSWPVPPRSGARWRP